MALIALSHAAPGDRARTLSLSFAERDAWTVSADDPWWALVDLRDMLNLFHPLSVSETGRAAGAWREVTIPADWRPPFALRFYCADDYFADPQKHKPGQLGTESFFEHRFKQALIDGAVVWERDVGDDNALGCQTMFEVDLTPHVVPGRAFKLTLRVLDQVSTLQRNERDVWFIGGTWYAPGDGVTEEPPRFHTAVWFADPLIGEQAALRPFDPFDTLRAGRLRVAPSNVEGRQAQDRPAAGAPAQGAVGRPEASRGAAVEAAPAGARPHERVVAARHQARWPLPPPGEALGSPAEVRLVAPAAIPGRGFPITCGIPIPPAALRDAQAVRLQDHSGRNLPLQTKAIGFWPDGSVRWLLLNAVAPPGADDGDRFRLHLGKAGPRPPSRLRIARQGGRLTITTGALRVHLGGDPNKLIDSVFLPGRRQPALADVTPRMTVVLDGAETPVAAAWERIEVVEQGPVLARVELHGSLDAARRHIGRFTFRLYAYAGLPLLQTGFRIFNDLKPDRYAGTRDDPPLKVARLSLAASIPGGARGETAIGIADGEPVTSPSGELALIQDAQDHFAVSLGGPSTLRPAQGRPEQGRGATSSGPPQGAGGPSRAASRGGRNPAEGRRAQGWIATCGAGGWVQASLWRFWQQFPKSLAVANDELRVGLFEPAGAAPSYQPRFGEAKRHDVWFAFSPEPPSDETRQALGRLGDQPPRLFDGRWFCLGGGVNLLDPEWFEREPQLARYVRAHYGDVSTEHVTGQFGIRDFGDIPYGSKGQWCNGYWAMVQGALNWGLASGDRRWLERSFEIARHIADVDCVHLPPGGPDWAEWNGVTVALGTDHSVHDDLAKWPAFQIGESLVLHYWMTGDPDSLEAAVANADYIIRSQAGLGSVEARSQARPMLTLLRVWQATGDPKYLQAAARYVDLKFQTEHAVEWRRGAYLQPTYENWRCISAGLDSMYAHDLYEYYRLTGDLDAAQLVVAIADSVYAESMLPQEEAIGSFLFYPRYSRGSWYYTQMALLFYMAYDLTEDLRFLRAGRAAFARYLLCGDGSGEPMYQPFNNFGWLDPEFGGWRRRFEQVATEPFEVTGQTPIPDPARYQP